jgi:hypothetical protein
LEKRDVEIQVIFDVGRLGNPAIGRIRDVFEFHMGGDVQQGAPLERYFWQACLEW